MPSVDRYPSLVRELRTMRSRMSEFERQQLGVARKQAVVSPTITTNVSAVPTGLANIQECSVDIESLGAPLIVTFSCGLISNHFTAGWKGVQAQLAITAPGAGGAFVPSASVRTMYLHDNAYTQATTFTYAIDDPEDGLYTLTAQWGVVSQSAGMDAHPNPSNGLSRSFTVQRVGQLV